jgi:hypothetical protein
LDHFSKIWSFFCNHIPKQLVFQALRSHKKFSNVTLTQTCSKHPCTCRYIYNQSSITTRTRNKTILIKEVEQCHLYIYIYLSIGSSRSSQTSGG